MLISTDNLLTGLRIYSRTPQVVDRYTLLHTLTEAAIKAYVKWEIEAVANHVEYYDGTGYQDIILRQPFVTAINNVWYDPYGAYGQGTNPFPSTTLQTAGSDYALVKETTGQSKCGLLRRLTNMVLWWPSDLVFNRMSGALSYRQPASWPVGYGVIKVDYNYGFSTIPSNIQLAVITAVAIMANNSKYGFPLNSENLGAHSYSLTISKDPEFGTVRQLLSQYRNTAL